MSEVKHINKPALDIEGAAKRLKSVVSHTPLQYNANLSRKYQCSVYLKREDLQIVRSYKIRGAYNMMSQLSAEQLAKGVVCASAGNHAQGFAYSCKKLGVKGVVFMPIPSPQQKVNQTKMFGAEFVDVKLVGDTFDDTAVAAKAYTIEHGMTFVPPFDHPFIISGQATVGVEILEDIKTLTDAPIDYLFLPVGGGGLTAGVGTYFKTVSPKTKIIAQYPEGLEKIITENGKNISGGQRQRIAIARALYKNAGLLILDEPFNELDNNSENKLLLHLQELSHAGTIIILITHNKKSLLFCNTIISLDDK